MNNSIDESVLELKGILDRSSKQINANTTSQFSATITLLIDVLSTKVCQKRTWLCYGKGTSVKANVLLKLEQMGLPAQNQGPRHQMQLRTRDQGIQLRTRDRGIKGSLEPAAKALKEAQHRDRGIKGPGTKALTSLKLQKELVFPNVPNAPLVSRPYTAGAIT